MAKSATAKRAAEIAVVGIDIGKTTFHVVALDRRGAVVIRQKFSRSLLVDRLANMRALSGWRRASVRIIWRAS